MQIGNPAALDSARLALRDAFDDRWMEETAKTAVAQRAAHCAVELSKCDFSNHRFSNTEICSWGRAMSPAVIYA